MLAAAAVAVLCCVVLCCAVSVLSLSSHSAYGGLFADSAERRAVLPLIDWESKEQLAADEQFRAQRAGITHPSQGSGGELSAARRPGGKRCSGASGEQLQVGGQVDPALHSFVQRSWLPHRQHFDQYCAERVTDVWSAVAERDRQREERSRLTRRGQTESESSERKAGGGAAQRQRQIAGVQSSADERFDRTRHTFNTAPAFEPIQ